MCFENSCGYLFDIIATWELPISVSIHTHTYLRQNLANNCDICIAVAAFNTIYSYVDMYMHTYTHFLPGSSAYVGMWRFKAFEFKKARYFCSFNAKLLYSAINLSQTVFGFLMFLLFLACCSSSNSVGHNAAKLKQILICYRFLLYFSCILFKKISQVFSVVF